MKEVRTLTNLPTLQQNLHGGVIYQFLQKDKKPVAIPKILESHPFPIYHFELLWNASTDTILITSRNPTLEKPPPSFNPRHCFRFLDFTAKFKD